MESEELTPDFRSDAGRGVRSEVRRYVGPENAKDDQPRSDFVYDRSQRGPRPQTPQGSGLWPNAHERPEPLASEDFGFRPQVAGCNRSSHEGQVQRVGYGRESASENERRDVQNERRRVKSESVERRDVGFERRDMQSGKRCYESEARGSRASVEDHRFSVEGMLSGSDAEERNIREMYESESGGSGTVEATGSSSSSGVAEFESESKQLSGGMRSGSQGEHNRTRDVSGSPVGRGPARESPTGERRHARESSSRKRSRGEQARAEPTKRPRTNYTPEQVKTLEEEFSRSRFLVGDTRRELAVELDLTEKQVCILF